MTEPIILRCRGFEENVVLTVKNCFYEEEMRKILIEKNGDKVIYHDRLCSTDLVPFEGQRARVVSSQCYQWFNSLEQIFLPQLSGSHDDFDIFNQYNENDEDNNYEVNNGGECYKDERVEEIHKSELKKIDHNVVNSESNNGDRPLKITQKEKLFECEICGLKFVKEKSLGIHRGKRHKIDQDTKHTCCVDGCKSLNINFTELQLKKHMRQIHKIPRRGRKPKDNNLTGSDGSEVPKKDCEMCGKRFESQLGLEKHVKRTHETKQRPCHICGQMVKELSIHIRNQHTQKNIEKYFCEFCGRGFTGYSGYQFHVAGHTGEKKYQCGGCVKSYRTSSESKKCERGHQGIYKWNCSLCSYRCHQRNKFVRHTRTHTKSEPYGCPLCDHRTARKDYLQKHIGKSHAGITLDQVESLHPNMYNIDEKISFVEGRESRTTEDIREKVMESRLGKVRQEEEQVEVRLERELGELIGEQRLSIEDDDFLSVEEEGTTTVLQVDEKGGQEILVTATLPQEYNRIPPSVVFFKF